MGAAQGRSPGRAHFVIESSEGAPEVFVLEGAGEQREPVVGSRHVLVLRQGLEAAVPRELQRVRQTLGGIVDETVRVLDAESIAGATGLGGPEEVVEIGGVQ